MKKSHYVLMSAALLLTPGLTQAGPLMMDANSPSPGGSLVPLVYNNNFYESNYPTMVNYPTKSGGTQENLGTIDKSGIMVNSGSGSVNTAAGGSGAGDGGGDGAQPFALLPPDDVARYIASEGPGGNDEKSSAGETKK